MARAGSVGCFLLALIHMLGKYTMPAVEGVRRGSCCKVSLERKQHFYEIFHRV
jgi:hypothetical protein